MQIWKMLFVKTPSFFTTFEATITWLISTFMFLRHQDTQQGVSPLFSLKTTSFYLVMRSFGKRSDGQIYPLEIPTNFLPASKKSSLPSHPHTQSIQAMDPKPLSDMKKCSTPSLDSPKDGHPIATSDSKIKIEFRTNKKASELALECRLTFLT